MLSAENINLHYGSSQILYGVSVAAKIGEITCVMGSNGVGKTSLLRVLSGTHPSSGGRYYLASKEVTNSRSDMLAKSGVAYVPQGRLIFPMLTVRENLQTGFACLPHNMHDIPDDIYALFPVLKTMLERRGGDLSGAQPTNRFPVDLCARDGRYEEIVQPCLLLFGHTPCRNLLQWSKALTERLKRVLVECLSFKPKHTEG